MATKTAPGRKEIEEARRRLEGVARVTPVYGTETLSRLIGRQVSLKAENLQRTGSFKVRGAVNKISTLSDDEKRSGVVAASAGNHGQAVAWAAREAGVKATIFMSRGVLGGGPDVEQLPARLVQQLQLWLCAQERAAVELDDPLDRRRSRRGDRCRVRDELLLVRDHER